MKKPLKFHIKCRKNGITVRSTIDLMICQTAIENELFLLHNDKDFDDIAKVYKNLKYIKFLFEKDLQ